MGLAKFGIVNGVKVPIGSIIAEPSNSDGEGLSKTSGTCKLDKFSEDALSRFGFLGIAHKISTGHYLSRDDIKILIEKAGMPVLMKLVTLTPRTAQNLSTIPAVLLPINDWIKVGVSLKVIEKQSCEFLRAVKLNYLHVAFDYVDLRILNAGLGELIKNLSCCRPGIVLVGPAVDELCRTQKEFSQDESDFISRTLRAFKECGIQRLRSVSSLEYLEMQKKEGFINSVVTYVNRFTTPAQLANELYNLNSLTDHNDLINCWAPGILSENDNMSWGMRQAINMHLLRVLAIGSVALRNIPVIRASSIHFSFEAMKLASYFGANDLGFGAFDQRTKEVLHLQALNELSRIVAPN